MDIGSKSPIISRISRPVFLTVVFLLAVAGIGLFLYFKIDEQAAHDPAALEAIVKPNTAEHPEIKPEEPSVNTTGEDDDSDELDAMPAGPTEIPSPMPSDASAPVAPPGE